MLAKFEHTVNHTFLYLLAIAWLMTACALSPNAEPVPEGTQFQAPEVLATPAAQSPAAGICGEFSGELVTIVINPDIPDPRCARIQPTQKLVVINHRGEVIQVRIGDFEASIQPDSQQLFDLPFGEYLAPGVHLILVSPCCGAELVLGMP